MVGLGLGGQEGRRGGIRTSPCQCHSGPGHDCFGQRGDKGRQGTAETGKRSDFAPGLHHQ